MYYRIEAKRISEDVWKGIFQALPPYAARRAGKGLTPPKWYKNHKEPTEAWFTEHGFRKFYAQINAAVDETNSWRSNDDQYVVRIRKTEKIRNAVMQGSVQVICIKGEIT